MGEEAAGVDAVRIALARIAAGQSETALVGGASNAERFEAVLQYVMGRSLARDNHTSVWERGSGGMELGTMSAFLVLEEKQHAQKRGAKPFAQLASVESNHVKRSPGAITAVLERMWAAI